MDAVTLDAGSGACDDADRSGAETPVSLQTLLDGARRVVVCAPHPDDEVLGCGGLLAACVAAGVGVLVVSITDGEACYPDDATWTRAALRKARRQELAAALAVLGVPPRALRRFAIADGGVADAEHRVADAMTALLDADDLVFAPCEFDGHPDHEATFRATRRAATARQARLREYPIWAGEFAPIPPHGKRALALPLGAPALRAKAAAIDCFATQLGTCKPAIDAPILPASVLARFRQPTETFFA